MRVAVTPSGPVQGRRVAVTGLGALTLRRCRRRRSLERALMRSEAPASKRIAPFDATPPRQRQGTSSTSTPLRSTRSWPPTRRGARAGSTVPYEDAGSIVTTGIGGLQTVLEQDAVLTPEGPRSRLPLPRAHDDAQRRHGRGLHALRTWAVRARPSRPPVLRARTRLATPRVSWPRVAATLPSPAAPKRSSSRSPRLAFAT